MTLNILQQTCQGLDSIFDSLKSNAAAIYPDGRKKNGLKGLKAWQNFAFLAVEALLSDCDVTRQQLRQKLINLSNLITEGESLDTDYRNALEEFQDVAERYGYSVDRPPSAAESHESLENYPIQSAAKKHVRIQLPTETQSALEVSQIQPVSQSEFDRIPAYMRGRTSVDQLNLIIARINEAVIEKYELLKLNFNQLSKIQKDLVIRYRDQDCKETAGQYFIVEGDLKSKLNGRETAFLNKTGIPMLRHLGRTREVRGSGKLVRFVVS